MTFNERKFRSSKDWQTIARNQLAREPICQGCEAAPASEVDHITPISRGGAPRDRTNLQSLCGTCHRGKTAAEREGKTWTPPKWRGCDINGMPNDPNHPWHQGGGVRSLETGSIDRRAPSKLN